MTGVPHTNVTPDELLLERATALADQDLRLKAAMVAARREHGLTQAQVAERMGVHEKDVAALERYDSDPTLSLLRRYALAVEVRFVHTVTDAS